MLVVSAATFARQWLVPADACHVGPTRDRVVAEFQAGDVYLDQSTIDNLKLLVSEIVTNAVKYAHAPELAVGLAARDGELYVQVTDGAPIGPVKPRPAAADLMAESGRGLFLVDVLAKDWDMAPEDGGKTVWITLDLPKPPRAQPMLTRHAAALARLIQDVTPQIRVHVIPRRRAPARRAA